MEKLGPLLFCLLALAACNSQPASTGSATPVPVAAAKPAKRHFWQKKIYVEDPTLVPTPHEPRLLSTPAAELRVDMDDDHLFEDVAFKTEDEVQAMLGQADARLQHASEENSDAPVTSWYYQRSDQGLSGKKVSPEIRFIDGKARFVVFWTPEVMRSLIKDAIRAKGSTGGDGKQSFAFADSSHFLGVGTPQDTVLADMGDPDAKSQADDGTQAWDYDTLVVENGSPRRLTVFIKDGKVVEVRGRQ